MAKGTHGFAWVCVNDARKVLPERDLRGLLIKKFGFSVGGRDQFARFFGRGVFNSRITGEIIITNTGLLPNAARTEFEPSVLRESLYMALGHLALVISSWADAIQTELKAREELEIISREVFNVSKEIPANERDIPLLLSYHNLLISFEKRLDTHDRTLQNLNPSLLERTRATLNQCLKQITEILTEHKRGKRGRPKRIEEALESQASAPSKDELLHLSDRPLTLVDAIAVSDLESREDIDRFLQFLDGELRQKLSPSEYSALVEDVVEFLNENL